jgi:hypothetical protein
MTILMPLVVCLGIEAFLFGTCSFQSPCHSSEGEEQGINSGID